MNTMQSILNLLHQFRIVCLQQSSLVSQRSTAERRYRRKPSGPPRVLSHLVVSHVAVGVPRTHIYLSTFPTLLTTLQCHQTSSQSVFPSFSRILFFFRFFMKLLTTVRVSVLLKSVEERERERRERFFVLKIKKNWKCIFLNNQLVWVWKDQKSVKYVEIEDFITKNKFQIHRLRKRI